VLIEPVPHLARSCRKVRKQSNIFQCALGGPDQSGETIEFTDLDLMGRIVTRPEDQLQIKIAEVHHGTRSRTVEVTIMTLSEIIDQSDFENVTLMSLDVEGYELIALAGLDFVRHCPEWLVIETSEIDKVREVLDPFMNEIVQLTNHDYLFNDETRETAQDVYSWPESHLM
jgi:FkbM family methyltransferase